jgi:hypothetical protein
MAQNLYCIPAGQIMTVTPDGNVQVYRPGAASAGGFLSGVTSYGPYTADRRVIVDGKAAVVIAEADPAAYRGTFVCNGTTAVTVPNANVLATDEIGISLNTIGGTVGAIPRLDTITPGTGFTVKGTAGDTSTYNYAITRNAV